MASVFSRIIAGELPGRFVWSDDVCVAFLTIEPFSPGHTLVVPREEVDHWVDLDTATWAHVCEVAQHVGAALDAAFTSERVGVIVAGFEVPHTHVHVVGADGLADLDFASADRDPDPDALDEAQDRLRAALRDLGHGEHVPGD